MSTKKTVVLAMFTVIALTIFVIESAIPLPLPIPGMKLGLANIITLIVLLNFSPLETILVLFCRILLATLFTGQAMSLLYSLCGGFLCLLSMFMINRLLKGHYIFLTSIFGALFHNLGQLLAAYFITSTLGVFSYLPFLMLSSIVTGLFTGLCAFYAQKYLTAHLRKLL